MRVLLVRHGQPAWFVDGLGVNNPELTALGHQQAAALGDHLATPDRLWISPATRSQQTAAPLRSEETPGETLDWLQEVRTPDYDGLTPDAMMALFRGTDERSVEEWWQGLPGGEPIRDFVERVSVGFETTLQERFGVTRAPGIPGGWHNLPRHGTLVIVSHAGTSGVLLHTLLGLEQVPWPWRRFDLAHTGIVSLRTIKKSGAAVFALEQFNALPHLSDDQITR